MYVTQFAASLIVSDDPKPLPTTVELHERSLTLTAGDQAIGTWPLDQVELSRVLGGFKLQADGETVTLKIPEADNFADELELHLQPATKAKKQRQKVAKTPKGTSDHTASTSGVTTATRDHESGVTRLDERLEVAQKRFGKYLPDWFFTRGGLIVLGVGLLSMLLFRQTFSKIFLIIAAIGLTTSAVALVDQVIAMRIFRGKITAIQGLIGSLSTGLLGLLIGWRL